MKKLLLALILTAPLTVQAIDKDTCATLVKGVGYAVTYEKHCSTKQADNNTLRTFFEKKCEQHFSMPEVNKMLGETFTATETESQKPDFCEKNKYHYQGIIDFDAGVRGGAEIIR